MRRILITILAVSAALGAKAQEVYSLKQCIETGLERNYSIRIIRNEQLISDNNATQGNAGYLPTIDLSGGFSGTVNNNRNKLSDGTTEKENGVNSETGNIGLNVNWTVFDGFGIQAEYARLKELLDGRDIDDARILTEAAIFADKTAVDEETVRLRSHIRQYRDILALSEPVGRKLDFLTQELNRETNTIGSKCNELDITRVVVEMKGEIEKIREQIQNLE